MSLYLVTLISGGEHIANVHVEADSGFEARKMGREQILSVAQPDFTLDDDDGFISRRCDANGEVLS